MKIKLPVIERIGSKDGDVREPNIKIIIMIHLDKLKLTIQKKQPSLQYVDEYSRVFEISLDSNIEEIIQNFYLKYLELKSIENYWSNAFKDGEVIEINIADYEKSDD